jgi:hypothetical protein
MKLKIYRVQVNADRAMYSEKSYHLIHAKNSSEAIRKAVREARKTGSYKSYDAVNLELIGDAL